MSKIITITTDFGDTGAYVGIMKGVILGINPEARLVDLSHTVGPQNILAAQFVLEKSAPYFPEGTVHLAVVDPGVGSARREIVVDTGAHRLVGPDNGLFTPFLDGSQVFEIKEKKYCLPEISSTFHGRDIFAAIAAHLSTGITPDVIGPPITNPVRLPRPRAQVSANQVAGEVIFVDSFGNLITNIPEHVVASWDKSTVRTALGNTDLTGIARSYAAPHVPDGTVIVLVGSTQHLEIAVVNGSAAAQLGLEAGAPVTLSRS